MKAKTTWVQDWLLRHLVTQYDGVVFGHCALLQEADGTPLGMRFSVITLRSLVRKGLVESVSGGHALTERGRLHVEAS